MSAKQDVADRLNGVDAMSSTNKPALAREKIRTIRRCGCVLHVYDTGHTDWRGQSRLAYRLRSKGRTLFEGDDFCGSPLHADDSDATVGSLLGFLTLKPGDTDADYFASYTPEQMTWCQSSQAEALSFEAMRMRGELQ